MRLVVLFLFAFIHQFHDSLAFEIYWNVPSKQCKDVRPDKYDIITNKNREFRGEKIVIFYEPDLGLYPWCEPGPNDVKNKCQKMINGGVPQAVNITAHLEKTQLDIANGIPDPDYDGLAIIDWERWRPLYDLNWSNRNVYKELSVKLIMKKYPKLKQDTATYLARFFFDKAAKEMFVETIRIAKEMRPKAKWAFWDYPMCNYDVAYGDNTEESNYCRPEFGILNEQLLWMFNVSDLIIPPAYFYVDEYSPASRQKHIYAKIAQAEEINAKLYPKKLPIYLYIKMEYIVEWNTTGNSLTSPFYTKADVCNSIKFPYDMGVKGVVIWSTSSYMKKRCGIMADYMENVLGPFSKAVVDKSNKCSQKQCNGNGRCAVKKRLPLAKCELAYQPEMKCICNNGFTGRHCDIAPSTFTKFATTEFASITRPTIEVSESTESGITPSPSSTPTIRRNLLTIFICLMLLL